ncbi:MAG: hypothetical protein H6707_08135 [Deltaproteobacteria bacterium]|nr:hypothetical protein [Deltaproteobacteria bacterium]
MRRKDKRLLRAKALEREAERIGGDAEPGVLDAVALRYRAAAHADDWDEITDTDPTSRLLRSGDQLLTPHQLQALLADAPLDNWDEPT